MNRRNLVSMIAALLVGLGIVSQGRAQDQPLPVVESPGSEQIQQWVDELDSPRFAVRESATEKLIESSAEALGPVALAVQQGNLEVISRGIHILEEGALSGDPSAEDAASAALEQIAKSDSTAAARAFQVLQSLATERQARAFAALRSHGGSIEVSYFNVGLQQTGSMMTLHIGSQWSGDATTLKHLRWLIDVPRIVLEGEAITDDYLVQVAKHPNLTNLEIKRTRITDEGLASLAHLDQLHGLLLYYMPLTDNAIDQLAKVESLETAHLFGTDITEEGRDRLQQAFPGALIDYRRGGFMGIGCIAHPRGCALSTVAPESAAQRAGLQPGDVITTITNEPVPSFEVLTQLIARHKAGETVAIEVLRGTDLFEAEVTLDEWE